MKIIDRIGARREGMILQTGLVLMVMGIVSLGTLIQHRMRSGAHQGLIRSLARRQVLTLAESALDEAGFRIFHPLPGEDPLEGAGPVDFTLRSEKSEELAAARSTRYMSFELSEVRVRETGSRIQETDRITQGFVDFEVHARAGCAGLLGQGLVRRVVRRYRFQVYTITLGPDIPPLMEQIRLSPDPLTQWIQ